MSNPTDWVWWGGVVAMLIWETWTLVNHRKGDTITESVRSMAEKSKLVPFFFGMLMGHFFWAN